MTRTAVTRGQTHDPLDASVSDDDFDGVEWVRSLVLDASAVVKLVVSEAGSAAVLRIAEGEELCYLSSVSFVEALGVLKRLWNKGGLDTESYLRATYLLVAYTREGGILILEDEPISDYQVLFKTEELARKHELDIADALQLFSLRFGRYSRAAGESRPVLVTGDAKLAAAARAENLLVWYCVDEPTPPLRQP